MGCIILKIHWVIPFQQDPQTLAPSSLGVCQRAELLMLNGCFAWGLRDVLGVIKAVTVDLSAQS